MSNYRPFKDVLEESLKDPETRAEWSRTQLARDVSIWLQRYRRDHHLTQAALAERLGWKQPVVARLESGEHEPSLSTLHQLVERLGTAARIQIEPDGIHVHFVKRPRRSQHTPKTAGLSRSFIQRVSAESETLQPA